MEDGEEGRGLLGGEALLPPEPQRVGVKVQQDGGSPALCPPIQLQHLCQHPAERGPLQLALGWAFGAECNRAAANSAVGAGCNRTVASSGVGTGG